MALTLIFHSCSSSEGPSPADVPSSASMVALVSLPPEQIAAMLPERLAEVYSRAEKCCDLSRIMVYRTDEAQGNFTALKLTDAGAFEDMLRELGWQKRKTESTEAYCPADAGEFGPCIIVRDSGAWLLPTVKDIKTWRESLKQAEKSDFGSLGLLPEGGEGTILTACLSPSVTGMGPAGSMAVVKGTMAADSSLTFTASIINKSDRKTLPLTALAPVTDGSYRHYMPQQPSLTVAAGLTQGINWSGLVDLFGPGLSTQNQGLLQSLLPYMNKLEGTFAIGIGPFDAKNLTAERLEDQRITIYATLKANGAAEAVEEINGNLRAKGLNPQPRADGVYSYNLDGIRYSYTAMDNRFVFALNRDLIPVPAADTSREAPLTAGLTLPPLKTVSPTAKADYAPQAELTMGPESVSLTVKSGKSSPITAFSYYLRILEELRENRYSQPDGYYE